MPITRCEVVYAVAHILPIFESVGELLTEDGTFLLGIIWRDKEFHPTLAAAAEAVGLVRVGEVVKVAEKLAELNEEEESAKIPAGMTGALAALQAELSRARKKPLFDFGESEEKVELLEFRRSPTSLKQEERGRPPAAAAERAPRKGSVSSSSSSKPATAQQDSVEVTAGAVGPFAPPVNLEAMD